MQSVVDDVFSDSLSFSAGLLTELGADWVNRITYEIGITDLLVKQVWILARNLVIADGGSNGEDRGNTAREQAYFRLDSHFRQWLESIRTEDEKDEICAKWFATAQRIIRNLGKELLNQCGPQAYVGRRITDTKNKISHTYTAPSIYNQFLSKTNDSDSLVKSGRKEVKQ